jgi:uncharacterized protein
MKRTGLEMLAVVLGLALAACGSDSKASQSTVPVAEAPVEEPVAEAPVVAPEPVKPAEPPAPTYLAGKWVWFELSASDVEKAKAFYGELLGWTIEEKEMGGQKYSSITNAGKEIGLVQALPADAKQKKLSPGWMGYVSVPDVDAAVASATTAGATVVMPAMDMPSIGRFAVLSAPATGAPFGVVKAAKGDEADAMPTIGQILWLEHQAKDAKKVAESAALFAAIAGYENQTMKSGKNDYTVASGSGKPRMGFAKAPKSAAAGKFAPYVMVADVDATVKAATKLKGKVITKPMDVPNVGRVALLADPQGAVFGVMAPAMVGGATPPPDAAAAPGTEPATPPATPPATEPKQ